MAHPLSPAVFKAQLKSHPDVSLPKSPFPSCWCPCPARLGLGNRIPCGLSCVFELFLHVPHQPPWYPMRAWSSQADVNTEEGEMCGGHPQRGSQQDFLNASCHIELEKNDCTIFLTVCRRSGEKFPPSYGMDRDPKTLPGPGLGKGDRVGKQGDLGQITCWQRTAFPLRA